MRGLQSLCRSLDQNDIPALRDVAQQLRALTLANFSRLAEQLHIMLVPLMPVLTEIPGGFVVSNNPNTSTLGGIPGPVSATEI